MARIFEQCRIDGCDKPTHEQSSLCLQHMEKGKDALYLFVKHRSKRPISLRRLMKVFEKISVGDEPVAFQNLIKGS